MNQRILVVIAGKTCSGKSHLEKALQARGFSRVVSSTTRQPRYLEVNGVDYHFTNGEEFAREDAWVEKELVNGNLYGTTKQALNEALSTNGKAVIVVDPKGANNYRKLERSLNIRCLFVYVDVPEDLFARRMVERILSGGAYQAASNAKRLAHCMTTERDWERLMLFANLRIYRFDESTEAFFVNEIESMVNAKQGVKA